MTSLPSPSDNVCSVQNTEISYLTEMVANIKQERDDAKAEAMDLVGATAKHSRRMQTLEDKVSDLTKQMKLKDKELARVNAEHASSRRKLREQARLPAPIIPTTPSKPTVSLRPESSKALLKDSQVELARLKTDFTALHKLYVDLGCELTRSRQDCADLKELHADTDCGDFVFACNQRVDAAEADAEGLRHLLEANKLRKNQDVETDSEILRLLDQLRSKDKDIISLEGRELELKAQIAHLSRKVRGWRPAVYEGQDPKQGLRVANVCESDYEPSDHECINFHMEMKPCKLMISDVHCVATKPQAPPALLAISAIRQVFDLCFVPKVPQLDLSSATEVQVTPAALAMSTVQSVCIRSQASWACAPFAGNVTINLSTADRKNWSLMQRIQSVISAKFKLDIKGPPPLIEDFVAGMSRAEADYTRWQNVARNSLDEVEALRCRRPCNVPSHQSLVDDLAAKELQLQMQATLVAQWQKESAQSYASVQLAVKALHAKRISGTCLCDGRNKRVGRHASF